MEDGQGVLADGTRYERLSGEEKGANGFWYRWTSLRGVSQQGKVGLFPLAAFCPHKHSTRKPCICHERLVGEETGANGFWLRWTSLRGVSLQGKVSFLQL